MAYKKCLSGIYNFIIISPNKGAVLKYIFLGIIFSVSINAKPLSVLFVTNKFPYEPRTYIDTQITQLIDLCMNVNVLASESSQFSDYPIAQQYNFENITYYKTLPPDKKEFDIIYCQFPGQAKKMLKERKKNNIFGKIVCCFRAGCELTDVANNLDYYKKLFQNVDLILVVCKAFKKKLIVYGCPPEKIIVHHSAIDIDSFTFKPRLFPQDEKIKILTIGRLHPMKGFNFLIEAIAQVKNIYPHIECNIYGTGSEYHNLKELIDTYNLQETVFLKGYAPHNSIPHILNEHHIFVSASYTTDTGSSEGIPNVLMEAMATGILSIGTKHSGIPEIITHNLNGFLVVERNSAQIAEQIIYLIKNQHCWDAISVNAREKVIKEHNIKKQITKLINIFNKLIQE